MQKEENKKIKKTEQHFYDGARNRTQLHFGEASNKTRKCNKVVTKEIEHINDNNTKSILQFSNNCH